MSFSKGEIVTLPDGSVGEIIVPSTGGSFVYYTSQGNMNTPLHAVRLDSGEVKHFVGDALAAQ